MSNTAGCPGVLEAEMKKMTELQSILVSIILAAGGEREKKRMEKLLEVLLKQDNIKASYVEAVVTAEPSLHVLLLGSLLVPHVQGPQADKLRGCLVEILLKVVLTSKVKVRLDLLDLSAAFLRTIDQEEFKGKLLPAINKYLLRSPEIALGVVASILGNLSIDLSSYTQELGKTFSTNLKSKDDATREDAVKATLALSRQISNQEAVEGLVRQLFSVLGGSEGKITVNTHKASLIAAIGNLTNTAVSGSGMTTVATLAAELFVKFLESEAHEGTLVAGLEMFTVWAAKFSSEIPAKLVDWIPKGLTSKASTSPVKCAYLVCLHASLQSSNLSSALPLLPVLIKVGLLYAVFRIRIRFILVSRIRIRFNETDPDPGSKKSWKI